MFLLIFKFQTVKEADGCGTGRNSNSSKYLKENRFGASFWNRRSLHEKYTNLKFSLLFHSWKRDNKINRTTNINSIQSIDPSTNDSPRIYNFKKADQLGSLFKQLTDSKWSVFKPQIAQLSKLSCGKLVYSVFHHNHVWRLWTTS